MSLSLSARPLCTAVRSTWPAFVPSTAAVRATPAEAAIASAVLPAMVDAVSPLLTATGIDRPIKCSGSVPAAVAGLVKLMLPVAPVPLLASASGPQGNRVNQQD